MTAWRFEIPGQPPSWNASYRIVRKFRSGKVPYHTLAKTQKVIDYQTGARLIVASAKPSRWKPEGQVRIWYWLYLSKDIDCDNIMKAIHDVIESVTGVNDAMYLPVVVSKEVGCRKKDAKAVVVVEDPASPLQVAAALAITPTPSSSGS
jgi:Holliday junction resolvase RusA-like endonuclease